MALCGWLCVSYNSLFLVSVHFEHSVQSGYPKNRAKPDRGENTTQTAKTPRPRSPLTRRRPARPHTTHHPPRPPPPAPLGPRAPPEAGEPARAHARGDRGRGRETAEKSPSRTPLTGSKQVGGVASEEA